MKLCYRTCSENVVGELDHNVVDIAPNIVSELACKRLCLNTADCSCYTYFYPNSSLYHHYCVLQTEFVPPAQPCSSCASGPAICSATTTTTPTPPTTTTPGCSLAMEGELSQSLMITSVGQTSEIRVSGAGPCDLTLLVVGGGGRDDAQVDSYGGGGSGRLQYRSLQVAPGTVLAARVGGQREASSLASSSKDTVTAGPGQDSRYTYGGRHVSDV